jgi:uncharacterized protein YjeT (DUF2065 family)
MHAGRIEAHRREFRAALIALGAPLAAIGAWAALAPHSWFDEFPGGGRHWVSALGPYNEHLTRDVGSFLLAVGVLVVFAGVVLERRLVQAALIALLVYSVPHLAYHLTELDAYSTTDNVLNIFTLVLIVVVPLLLLALTRERVSTPAAAPVPGPQLKEEVTYGTR